MFGIKINERIGAHFVETNFRPFRFVISGKMADCPPLKKQKGGVCRIGDPFWGVLGFDLQRRGIVPGSAEEPHCGNYVINKVNDVKQWCQFQYARYSRAIENTY